VRRLHTVNDYHGFAGFPAGHARPPAGSAVTVVPNHVCAAVNLHDRLYVIRGGEIVDEWRVEARGR
jgi:D-serine deaminase-like pyridoxal phosphate-dependent protein